MMDSFTLKSSFGPGALLDKCPVLRRAALRTTGAIMLLAAFSPLGSSGATAAQPAPSSSDATLEEVVVTGTRITSAGFNAPTPTTVLSGADLAAGAQLNVMTALTELPSIMGTFTQQAVASSSTIGGNFLNPRNLGSNRVLVLMDGQRLVGSNTAGTVDISQLPQSLIQRVDIVTGGASASWGSDAVSGVANIVLNNYFSGFKADVNGGITSHWDDPMGQLQLAGGKDLFDGRGHFVLGGDLTYDDGIRHNGDRSWYTAEKVIPRSIAATPAGQPQYIRSQNVYETQDSPGGIITTGPLKGTYFGPGGVPLQFTYGSYVVDPFQIGGTPVDLGTNLDLASRYNRHSGYGRFSWKLTDRANVYVSALYARVNASVAPMNSIFRTGDLTIQCDNAFLPAQVTAGCATNKITSFGFGTGNQDLGSTHSYNQRTLRRVALGGDGDFDLLGKNWKWDTYVAHSENHVRTFNAGNIVTANYLFAIDAVRDSTGQIVCRSAAARAAGCQPLNIIGTGVASEAGAFYAKGNGLQSITHNYRSQDVAGLTFNGQPFSDWAGPVAIATGLEYRAEKYDSPTIDPFGSVTATSQGKYNVAEGFVEAGVPLFNSKAAGKADLSLAGRREKYSTAGWATAWKAGFTYETPVDGLRLRGLESQDIRAPGLNELFAPVGTGNNTVVDFLGANAGKTFTVQNISGGNRALKPEVSRTKQVGVVYQPDRLPGFHTSVDYWNILIEDGVSSLTPQQTVDVCARGNADVCSIIVRNPAGVIASVSTQLINLASVKTDGLDLEVAYNMGLGRIMPNSRLAGGTLNLRFLATHILSFVADAGVPGLPVRDTTGQLQQAQSEQTSQHWRILGTQSLDLSKWAVTLTERWTSSGVIGVDYIECTSNCPLPTADHGTINNNHVPSTFYVDVGGRYDFSDRIQGYFKVNNVADSPPTLAPVFNGRTNIAANGATGELLGRTYRLGVRVHY